MRWHDGRTLAISVVLWGLASSAIAAPPTAQTLNEWVSQLDSDRYATREQASQHLAKAGDAAIDVLVRAAAKESPETAWRACAILERIALEGSETALIRVMAAFEQLSVQNRPGLAAAARDLRARQAKMRRDRAAVRIRALGGSLSGGGDEGPVALDIDVLLGPFALPVLAEDGVVMPRIIGLEKAAVAALVPPPAEVAVPLPVPLKRDEPSAADLEDDIHYFPAGREFKLETKEVKKVKEPPTSEPMLKEAAELPAARSAPVAPPPDPPPPALPPLDVDALAPPPPADLPPMPLREPGEEPVDAAFDAAVDAALEGAVEGPIIGAIADAFVGEEVDVLELDEPDSPADRAAASLLMQEVLVLDQAWKGGDHGLAELADVPSIVNVSIQNAPLTDAALAHLAKLPRLVDLSVRGSQITPEGLRQFRLKSPKTRIYASGDALLGINAVRDGPCVLSSVYYGSGAFEAGLQQGDEIVSVGGHVVGNFSDLTIAVFRGQPGDTLAVEFKRGGKTTTVDVVLKDRSALEPRR